MKVVYALIGSDPFLQLEHLGEIVAQLPADVTKVRIDGSRADLATVLDEARSFSMFGGPKLIVVSEGDEFVSRHREKLESFFAEETPSNGIVLRLNSLPANQRIYKVIAKVGEIVKCEPPKMAELAGWLSLRAGKTHRVKIEPAAARQLSELIGNDLGRLDMELSKLAIMAESGTITADVVAKSVTFQRDQEIWEITTLLGRGKGLDAIARWRDLVRADNSAEFRMITWLGILLENMRTIQAAEANGTALGVVGKQIRIWDPKVMQEFAMTARRLGQAGVARQLSFLTELDRRIKSGLATAADGIERFMAMAVEGGA